MKKHSEVRHIRPEDYDGPKRSPELEANFKNWDKIAKQGREKPEWLYQIAYRNDKKPSYLNKDHKFNPYRAWRDKDYRKERSEWFKKEKSYDEPIYEVVSGSEYDKDGVYVGPMDSQDIAYQD